MIERKTNRQKGRAMSQEEMKEKWRAVSEEVLTGMAQWRKEHPKATFAEIEEEVEKRIARLRTSLLQEAAQESELSTWSQQPKEHRPVCPQCQTPLVARGKQRRKIKTEGGDAVQLERQYGTCPHCGYGFFPPG
jgi:RNase P subunit RPR2